MIVDNNIKELNIIFYIFDEFIKDRIFCLICYIIEKKTSSTK